MSHDLFNGKAESLSMGTAAQHPPTSRASADLLRSFILPAAARRPFCGEAAVIYAQCDKAGMKTRQNTQIIICYSICY